MDKKTKATTKGRQRRPSTQEELFLKKHVGMIHCENKLSLVQRKICNILLFNALDAIQTVDVHEINLRQLCSLMGYNSNDSQLVKGAIKGLMAVVMEWNLLDDGTFTGQGPCPPELITWNASSLLAGASIKKGVVYYSYSPQMKSILSSLDIYGRINLFVQAKFNSAYSLVLYENCVRFKNIQKTAWFPVRLFRSLMGVPDSKYPAFKEFKRNVITVAVNEINKKADIAITPQFKKSGRHIVAVQFEVEDNENYRPTFKKSSRAEAILPYQSLSHTLERLMAEFHLGEAQAREMVAHYPVEYILEKARLVKNKKNVSHLGAYLISALKNDYKQGALPLSAVPVKPVIENTYLREAKAASEVQSLKKKYMLYKIKAYMDFVGLETQDVQDKIKGLFESSLMSHVALFRSYRKFGLKSPFVMTKFIAFIDNHFSRLVGPYLTFDDFITAEEF